MASDWIKMRVFLRKDGRIAAIADFLSCERNFMDYLTDPMRERCDESVYEYITPHILQRLVVSFLHELWCTANHCGHAENGDLVLPFYTIARLDEMCDVPRIGAALEHVGWAIEEEDERGNPLVRLPNFLKYHFTQEQYRTPANSSGFVYFIEAIGQREVKIGFSQDPESRLKALQTARACELRLIHAFPGTVSDERDLHERFMKNRISGEWFTLTADIIAFIEQQKR